MKTPISWLYMPRESPSPPRTCSLLDASAASTIEYPRKLSIFLSCKPLVTSLHGSISLCNHLFSWVNGEIFLVSKFYTILFICVLMSISSCKFFVQCFLIALGMPGRPCHNSTNLAFPAHLEPKNLHSFPGIPGAFLMCLLINSYIE